MFFYFSSELNAQSFRLIQEDIMGDKFTTKKLDIVMNFSNEKSAEKK